VKRKLPAAAAAALAVAGVAVVTATTVGHSPRPAAAADKTTAAKAIPDHSTTHKTTTPIKHVVVIFDENISFDHYFGTYPNATNPKGEPKFTAKSNTPTVNGLSGALLTDNPNKYNPTRLDRSQAVTCDQNHSYKPEQQAADHGLMDQFSQFTDSGDCSAAFTGEYYRNGLVMDYYDGNTVTGLWNYAQQYALSDNSYDTVYGPSTPGALNLISGQTHGATASASGASVANGTLYGDADPTLDKCGKGTTVEMSGTNVGDLLNKKGVTWGWFQGGFKPTSRTADGTPVCGATHANIAGSSSADYSPHHNPFEYYKSTANPNHLPPSKVSMIGKTDQANHEYDLSDFWAAANNGNLPEVSYLKAAEYQDGHAGYSDPIDEQHWLVNTINHIQKLPQWHDTAVVIAYDDSDGWYDHVMSPVVNASNDPSQDALTGTSCGTPAAGAYQDRCGYGPRLPLLVISPYAKSNYVDNTVTDQSSILKFVEDNWKLGQIGDQSFDAKAGSLDGMFNFKAPLNLRPFLLDPNSGEPTHRW
jgi:phospholipase C